MPDCLPAQIRILQPSPVQGYPLPSPALGSRPAWTPSSPFWASALCWAPLCEHAVLPLSGPASLPGDHLPYSTWALTPCSGPLQLPAPYQHGHTSLSWPRLKASGPNVQEDGCLIFFTRTNDTLQFLPRVVSLMFTCLWKDGSLALKITFIL